MLADLYQDMPGDALAAAFASAWRDLCADPRERARGLPPVVSVELSGQARALLGCSQREAERLMYGADDGADGAAEGRVARRRENGEASMSFSVARDMLTSVAWGAAARRRLDWLRFVEVWWMRLDFLEAAQDSTKSTARRQDPSNPDDVLKSFRANLVRRARLAELEGDVRLTRWAADDAVEAGLAQICHTTSEKSVEFSLTSANVSQ